MGKMKVLQVNKLYPPVTGGIEKIVGQLSEGLADRTNTVALACQKKGPTQVERRNGVKVFRTSSLGIFFSMPLSLSFLRYFRRLAAQSDVVQIHMPFPMADLALLLSGCKAKVVLWWHSDIVRQKKLLVLYRPLMEWTLKRADRIIVATQGHIDGSEFLKPYENKCVIIPYGQDVIPSDEEVRRANTQDAATATTVGDATTAENAAIHFLFVGRLVPYKGCRYLLEAFSGMCRVAEHNADLTIVGDGPLKEELVAQATEAGLADWVTFKSGLTDEAVQEELSRCDVLVLPSVERSEAFGLVQIEAMAWGKPVINTSLPSGVPYVSLDHETGLTVPPQDADALRDAMEQLASDAALRKQYGDAARKRVKEHFMEQQMLDATFSLYKELVE